MNKIKMFFVELLYGSELRTLHREMGKDKRWIEDLQTQLSHKQRVHQSVTNIQQDKFYWVVTQGGFHEIRGSRLNSEDYSEVTKRALKNGFVVATREEAEALQSDMRALVGRI